MKLLVGVDLRGRLKRPAVALALLILTGLAATAVATNDRTIDTQFVARQQMLSGVQPPVLARVIASAPNPRPGLGRSTSTSAGCTPRGVGELRNPWTCVVHYARGGSVNYTVTIAPDGKVSAIDVTGQIMIHGCCVGPRPTQYPH